MMRNIFGYKIIQRLPIRDVTFFIGRNKRAKSPYITFFMREGNENTARLKFHDTLYEAQKEIVINAYCEIPMIEHYMAKEAERYVNQSDRKQVPIT